MELRHLRYFVAAAETQHFRRAAERLCVAQPALSRQVKDLEDELGVRLFERLKRGVRLNEPGRVFLEDARRVLASIETASERARRVQRGQVGSIRVAFSEVGAWQGLVPRSIREFRALYPDVELLPLPMGSYPQIEALRKDQIDAGFVYGQAEHEPGFQHLPVALEHAWLALQSTHRLAHAKKIRLVDLAGEPLIWTSREANARFYDQLMAACLAGGLTPRIVQEVVSGANALSLVAVGMGSALVTSAMRWVKPTGLVMRPIDDLSVPFRLDLIWLKSNRSPVLAQYIQTVRNVKEAIVAEEASSAGRAAA